MIIIIEHQLQEQEEFIILIIEHELQEFKKSSITIIIINWPSSFVWIFCWFM
jgi:hypothetical protein